MTATIVDAIYRDNKAVLEKLTENKEVSLEADAEAKLRKVLLLSVASYFEALIQELVKDCVERTTKRNEEIMSLVKQKAIDRQYHTYFQWSGNNANSFFSLFGSRFSDAARKDVANDADLKDSVRAFLELGDTRNQLVHMNFANFPLDKTADEIYQLYNKALRFLDYLKERLESIPNIDEMQNESGE